jgi:site-specific recombinase XerC
VRLYIVPVLGKMKLVKLKRVHIQEFYATLVNDKGLSPTLCRKVGVTLAVALNEVVRLDLIASNPTYKVRKPKAPKKEVQPLDADQARQFLDAARADRSRRPARWGRSWRPVEIGYKSGYRSGKRLAQGFDWKRLREGGHRTYYPP